MTTNTRDALIEAGLRPRTLRVRHALGARCSQVRKVFARPANCCQHLSAARLPLPGLKPLFAPEMRDVIPLADRIAFFELNRGKRAAIASPARGGSLQVRRLTLAGLARQKGSGRTDFAFGEWRM